MNGENQERPHIELFMYSLRQEFPEQQLPAPEIMGATPEAGGSWEVRTEDEAVAARKIIIIWLKWAWNKTWAKWAWNKTVVYRQTGGGDPAQPVLANALTRDESFGGIVYDTVNDKVYKVNQAGLRLFRALQLAASAGENVRNFKSKEFPQDQVDEFCAFLKGAGFFA